jgi:hypothetical protein
MWEMHVAECETPVELDFLPVAIRKFLKFHVHAMIMSLLT